MWSLFCQWLLTKGGKKLNGGNIEYCLQKWTFECFSQIEWLWSGSCRSDKSESETVSVSIYLMTKLEKLGQLFWIKEYRLPTSLREKFRK